jgi:hypothetical protein
MKNRGMKNKTFLFLATYGSKSESNVRIKRAGSGKNSFLVPDPQGVKKHRIRNTWREKGDKYKGTEARSQRSSYLEEAGDEVDALAAHGWRELQRDRVVQARWYHRGWTRSWGEQKTLFQEQLKIIVGIRNDTPALLGWDFMREGPVVPVRNSSFHFYTHHFNLT